MDQGEGLERIKDAEAVKLQNQLDGEGENNKNGGNTAKNNFRWILDGIH